MYFLFLAETYMMCLNGFYVTRNEISAGSDKRQIISPLTPIVKKFHFHGRHGVTNVRDFTMGFIKEISHFLSDPAEISFSQYIKNVETQHTYFS